MLDGGTVHVSVSDQHDEKVCIEVADQGSGMSQAALEHCFDPYYSGREAGRGLGLGLSKAQRIVALHRGELTLSNRPGGGAVARIVLRKP
jgi:signal transduction histidine kinase